MHDNKKFIWAMINMHQTQRCRNTQSISEFHKNTPTQTRFSQSSLEIPMFENALKLYSIVWDQIEENGLDTVNCMRPWSQGPSVKKPHSQPQQGNQRRMTPLSITREKLREFKKKAQNDSKKESQKQGRFKMQSPKPEVIKTSNESLETLKAN